MARSLLIVDGANVVGATPNGWWKDRPGAAAKLHAQMMTADLPGDEVVLVLEGQAKQGVRPGMDAHVRTVHAPRDGDSAIVAVVRRARENGAAVTVVTADRLLGATVEGLGASTVSPTWLLDRLGRG